MENQKQAHFLQLYNTVSAKISNYCRLICDSPSDAEDLLHDTIIAVYEKMELLKSDIAFPSFMFSTAYNIYSKQLRRRKFQGKYNEQATMFLQNADASPETITELKVILDKMKQLPIEQYETLILFHVSDLPLNEIQKIQNISLSAVKQRLKRGREKLLEMLNERQQHLILLLF